MKKAVYVGAILWLGIAFSIQSCKKDTISPNTSSNNDSIPNPYDSTFTGGNGSNGGNGTDSTGYTNPGGTGGNNGGSNGTDSTNTGGSTGGGTGGNTNPNDSTGLGGN